MATKIKNPALTWWESLSDDHTSILLSKYTKEGQTYIGSPQILEIWKDQGRPSPLPASVGELPEHLWRDDDGFIAQGKGDTYKTFADTNVNDDDIDDRERRTDQIIAAYNNTYAKGINPESIPQLQEQNRVLREALENLFNAVDLKRYNVKKDFSFLVTHAAAGTALHNTKQK